MIFIKCSVQGCFSWISGKIHPHWIESKTYKKYIFIVIASFRKSSMKIVTLYFIILEKMRRTSPFETFLKNNQTILITNRSKCKQFATHFFSTAA